MSEAMHIASFNIGWLRYGWDDERTTPFSNSLGAVYAVAAASPGYVWHLPDDEMEAWQQARFPGDDCVASALSVWETPEALASFAFRGAHGGFYRRRSEWFEAPKGVPHVLWPIAAGTRPTPDDGLARLKRLEAVGPGPEAYSWPSVPGAEVCAHG
ncbi:MAG: DUF3291 domain-containing protein [Pseudomonadota bacterium]